MEGINLQGFSLAGNGWWYEQRLIIIWVQELRLLFVKN
jgi:hypothetical protein